MMLTYKLIDIVDGFYHYEIYPEGKVADKGTLIFNPLTKVVKTLIEPNSPFDCLGHFAQDFVGKNGEFKESGMVAWY
ncbi:hypothetical protein [Lapidilactobacillus wuchangensis]|uniref:hypothetical protein n=1 Tax=Lapidilactobacillus wuchangensis TaxID=2486001 RepID=UPI000F767352|nr:hypothetical protein [Lapidilactobacillus wuchangensis]